MQNAILPSTCPKVAECQLYPSLSQLGNQDSKQGSVGPAQEHSRVLLVAGAPRGTERREERDGGGELSPGGSRESLKSHKMPEKEGDKQPLTPKRPVICITMHN